MDRERIENLLACLLGRLCLGGALLLASVPGRAAELALDARSPAGGELALAVGDSLWVKAAGLAPGGAADLRLRDASGAVVAEARLRADDHGEVAPALLWRRTGVAGCDCSDERREASGASFRTFEEAELALLGTKWSLELAGGGGILASRPLRFERTRTFQAYFSDAAGCPRRRLDPEEDVYVSFRGLALPPNARVFLVTDQPGWDEPLPLVEVRPGVGPAGEVITGISGPLSTYLVWPGDPKGRRSGYFAAWVRIEAGDEALHPLKTDRPLSEMSVGIPKSTEEGIVIHDWGCGPVH
jgi:hypothetical protein